MAGDTCIVSISDFVLPHFAMDLVKFVDIKFTHESLTDDMDLLEIIYEGDCQL